MKRSYIAAGIVIGIMALFQMGCGNTKDIAKQTADEIETENTVAAQPKTIIADYGELFQGKSGGAVIYNSAENTYTFYNEEICKIQVSPCSTFKIISTLAGLHNGVLDSKETRIGYSGTVYARQEWNEDVNLSEAFAGSCVWYFRKVIDAIGQEKMQKELNALNYGNCDVSEWNGSGCNYLPELNGFWISSSLKISPLEQVEILRAIMEGKTIYTQEESAVLKQVMLSAEEGSQKIYGKTGSAMNTAWYVGFAEDGEEKLYFAVYLDEENTEKVNGALAREIALAIIRETKD